MMLTRSSLRLFVLPALLFLALAMPADAGSPLVDIDEKPARPSGGFSCKGKYPASGQWGQGFLHVFNGTCYACPQGFSRTINPDVEGANACERHPFDYASATRHGKGGFLGGNCKGRQFLHIPNGTCYSCPSGYDRSIHGIESGRACAKRVRTTRATTKKLGGPGCPEGSFRHGLSDQCWSCPAGYVRSAAISLDGDLSKLDTACTRVTFFKEAENDDMPDENTAKKAEILALYGALIEQAVDVAVKLAEHREALDEARREKKPLAADIRRTTGADDLQQDAEKGGLKSMSLGGVVDVSALVGVTHGGGLSVPFTRDTRWATYTSWAFSLGATVGGDVGPEVGLWTDTVSAGDAGAHGLVFGASYGGGAAISLWFEYCPPKDGKICIFDRFLGFTVVPQLGKSAEAEYTRGVTETVPF